MTNIGTSASKTAFTIAPVRFYLVRLWGGSGLFRTVLGYAGDPLLEN